MNPLGAAVNRLMSVGWCVRFTEWQWESGDTHHLLQNGSAGGWCGSRVSSGRWGGEGADLRWDVTVEECERLSGCCRGRDKETVLYLDTPEARNCLFNFTLENGIISITWLKVEGCLMVQGLMWCFWWAVVRGWSSSFGPWPCGTPCCQWGGIAAALF